LQTITTIERIFKPITGRDLFELPIKYLNFGIFAEINCIDVVTRLIDCDAKVLGTNGRSIDYRNCRTRPVKLTIGTFALCPSRNYTSIG
jgi:hypothetical protein